MEPYTKENGLKVPNFYKYDKNMPTGVSIFPNLDDKNKIANNLEEIKKQSLKQLAEEEELDKNEEQEDNLEATQDVQFEIPQPRTSSNYCFVCSKKYRDFL